MPIPQAHGARRRSRKKSWSVGRRMGKCHLLNLTWLLLWSWTHSSSYGYLVQDLHTIKSVKIPVWTGECLHEANPLAEELLVADCWGNKCGHSYVDCAPVVNPTPRRITDMNWTQWIIHVFKGEIWLNSQNPHGNSQYPVISVLRDPRTMPILIFVRIRHICGAGKTSIQIK